MQLPGFFVRLKNWLLTAHPRHLPTYIFLTVEGVVLTAVLLVFAYTAPSPLLFLALTVSTCSSLISLVSWLRILRLKRSNVK